MQSEMGTSSSWQVSFISDISRCTLLKSLLVIWAFESWNFLSFCLHIWESCISRVTWVNTDGPCEYNISWQYFSTNPSFCLFVLLRIRVSSFRELLWQMLQERRALSCWAARDLDSPQVPAADFTASQLCSQSARSTSLRRVLVCGELWSAKISSLRCYTCDSPAFHSLCETWLKLRWCLVTYLMSCHNVTCKMKLQALHK